MVSTIQLKNIFTPIPQQVICDKLNRLLDQKEYINEFSPARQEYNSGANSSPPNVV
jgi:hypothetical protein